MGSMWRNAMRYLGLAPDDEFEEYEPEPERPTAPPPRAAGTVQSLPRQPITAVPQPGSRAHASSYEETRAAAQPPMASVRPLPVQNHENAMTTAPQVVRPRPNPAYARPNVVMPKSFADAQEVGDRFKGNQPVIMNLQGLDRDLTRRLIDFASGLCYGLAGHMERVAKDVFLLTPADVQVPDEEKRRLRGGLDES